MNPCQFCGAPATVHLTDIVNKKKREMHLCESCAREQNLIPDAPSPQLNLPALLQLLMSQLAPSPSEADADDLDPASLTCPDCGLKYAQFRADGRLGCPEDYDVFLPVLMPILERVHRGLQHRGKTPKAVQEQMAKNEIADLKAQLTDAIAIEDYEEAARLRDRIRGKEAAG
ncbi:UvrB/UvrC motif-containing protein [Limnoglobus roseus]|uniref:McsA n=1 Tax=Limnoglobus roseus TaxID=2598579 RepID=A0A5C1A866_9BACT|nr:UvrB/UvrC motif-containing protein [Limnoglobus roseus]QEL14373.1 McsA [Limnoglobus roseus]